MREILFRGKRMDDGEWVEGYLVKAVGGECMILPVTTEHCGGAEFSEGYHCGPTTVGQYTGLKDKHGKRIFEGDIMKQKDITHKGEIQIEGEKYLVTSSSGCWFGICKKTDYKRSIFLSELCNIGEVIGNIHDNPELLEK